MEIEHVAWVSLTAWWTAQQQGNLAVSHCLLGQIVINDQRVFTAVAEELAHGATRVRCKELQRCGFGSTCSHDDGVSQCAVFFELANNVGDGRLLLTDRYVDAEDAAVLLVDDCVDGQSGFTDLTVTDDQLTLATADRNHGIDSLVASLYRLVYRLTPDHARSNFLDRIGLGVVQRTFAVNWVTQCIDNATQQFLTHRNLEDAASALGAHAFSQSRVSAQYNGTHGVLLKVQRHTVDAARKLDHFAVHYVGKTMNPHDTVRHADDCAFVTGLGGYIELVDATLDDFTYFGRIELLHCSAAPSNSRFQCFG